MSYDDDVQEMCHFAFIMVGGGIHSIIWVTTAIDFEQDSCFSLPYEAQKLLGTVHNPFIIGWDADFYCDLFILSWKKKLQGPMCCLQKLALIFPQHDRQYSVELLINELTSCFSSTVLFRSTFVWWGTMTILVDWWCLWCFFFCSFVNHATWKRSHKARPNISAVAFCSSDYKKSVNIPSFNL